ncbi:MULTISPECIES: TPM domain-containing protein [unclassified Acinetobacter]|uniref:TPM domain-containing protein n=1 Tax=unclassified Acinetobacter TaxID=196816 RepID=UPI002934E30A|nr:MULTISPECIES: TPM domain-containing protein [unclassified Acinetobacter]WOE31077.1 TPM domain-containing protein [Acinetobacter sp. SAAs470]WOE39273.1 TPM domain-containing protein [Acinetobacter sp. SAAs474]
MVTRSDTTHILTPPKLVEFEQPSLTRWLKHFFYVSRTNKIFNSQVLAGITQAVEHAEQGHHGEIQVVIEGHIPAHQAYYQNVSGRARQLFAQLGVWDTEFNSGILLYINLCERRIEIVVDRGIQQYTAQSIWDELCQQMAVQFKQQQFNEAILAAIHRIGEILNIYYEKELGQIDNEINNQPVIL